MPVSEKIKIHTRNLFDGFLYSTNFFHDIRMNDLKREYTFSIWTKIFLGFILLSFFSIWFIKSPVNHDFYSKHFSEINALVQAVVIIVMAISLVGFSSFGLRDMFIEESKPTINSPVFWLSLIFEIFVVVLVFWIQLFGLIKPESQELVSKIGIYTLLFFAAMPTLVWIYKKTNPANLWMFWKICYQTATMWFVSTYNPHNYCYNKAYFSILKKELKGLNMEDTEKVREHLLIRANSDKVIINCGMLAVASIAITSLFTWISIWEMLVYSYEGLSFISTYVGLPSPWALVIAVGSTALGLIIIFVYCLIIRKVEITIVEQIEVYKQKCF